MTAPRVLLFGASWTPDEQKRELCKLWARSLDVIAPECDVLVIDCNSPFRPGAFLRDLGFSECVTPVEKWDDEGVALMFAPREPMAFKGSTIAPRPIRTCGSFSGNIGHLSLGGGDGWGRSFCKGLEIALSSGYEYVVYLEPDLIFAPKVMPIVEKMRRCGVKAAAPMDTVYHFIANEIMFLDVAYLRESRFVERYDWANPPPLHYLTTPEKRCEDLLKDELWILPIRGLRNDHHMLTRENIGRRDKVFPLGLDYLTHCRDFALYEMFMQINGLLPAPAEPAETAA